MTKMPLFGAQALGTPGALGGNIYAPFRHLDSLGTWGWHMGMAFLKKIYNP